MKEVNLISTFQSQSVSRPGAKTINILFGHLMIFMREF